MAHVQIDIEDYLDEVSTRVLEAELKQRQSRGEDVSLGPDFQIPRIAADDALDQAAMILRKIGRYDLGYKMDEIRVDYVNKRLQ